MEASNSCEFVENTDDYLNFTARIYDSLMGIGHDERLVDVDVLVPFGILKLPAGESSEKMEILVVELKTRHGIKHKVYMEVVDFVDRLDSSTSESFLGRDFDDLRGSPDSTEKIPTLYHVHSDSKALTKLYFGAPSPLNVEDPFIDPNVKTRNAPHRHHTIPKNEDILNEKDLGNLRKDFINKWRTVLSMTIGGHKDAAKTTDVRHKIIAARFYNPTVKLDISINFKSTLSKTLSAAFENFFLVNPHEAAGYDFTEFTTDLVASKGWKEWSQNPLGLYTIYISEKSFSQLVELQTGEKYDKDKDEVSCYRKYPARDLANDFAQKINESTAGTRLTKKKPQLVKDLLKLSAVRGYISDDKAQSLKTDGQATTSKVKTPRLPTAIIMGESANQWACNTLGWKGLATKPRQPVAEWLHRRAHGFREKETSADSFRNLIFGSRECNTQMMRAENAVHMLARHEKIQHLKVVTSLKPEPMSAECIGYHFWLTEELHYKISYTTVPKGDMEVEQDHSHDNKWEHKLVFKTMSRLAPLIIEAKIDEVLTNAYLENL